MQHLSHRAISTILGLVAAGVMVGTIVLLRIRYEEIHRNDKPPAALEKAVFSQPNKSSNGEYTIFDPPIGSASLQNVYRFRDPETGVVLYYWANQMYGAQGKRDVPMPVPVATPLPEGD